MKQLKAFIAGISLPAVLLPVIFNVVFLSGNTMSMKIHLLLWIPVFWGIWNVLYFQFFNRLNLFVWGAILGLLVAAYGVFFVHAPEEFFGAKDGYQYLPFIVAPLLYGFFWKVIVRTLNHAVGLDD